LTAPPISILLPCRDAAATLAECLDSIQAQTFPDFELVALDDHSTDATPDLLRHYAAGDSRIRVLDNPGSGLIDALNAGLMATRSRYVARMDGDDRMHPARLQRQYQHLRNNRGTHLLGCCATLFPQEIVTEGYREYMRWQNGCLSEQQIANEIYIESPFAHPSVVFDREAVLKLGGYRDGPFPEDYDLWLRLFHAGLRLEKIPDLLLEWRESGDRTSRVDSRYSREAFDRLRARYLARDPRFVARSDRFAIWGAGRKTRLRCRHLLAQGVTPVAWIDIDPRKIGNRIDGIPVVPPEWLDRRPHPFVLVYVANHGARELIGQELEQMGYAQGHDYLAVG
jgi:glycosyltransferase involved in cell wall biosynthesis